MTNPAPNTPQWRPFFFMVDKLATSGRETPNFTPGGIWMPPTGNGENVKRRGDTTGILLVFNGQTVIPVPNQQQYASILQHYRDLSIYHNQGHFWAVPCDATDPTMMAVHAPWRLVAFDHESDASDTYTSYVMAGGPELRLRCQRPSQRWPLTLLPRHLHCENLTPDEHSHLGGMIGNLNIIIALMAFSVRAPRVEETLPHCMVSGAWRGPNIPNHKIGNGWEDRRGVIVRIWTSVVPGAMTPDELANIEGGYSGKILP